MVDQVGGHGLRLEQRQDDVAAAEDERARLREDPEQAQGTGAARSDGCRDEQGGERDERRHRDPAGEPHGDLGACDLLDRSDHPTQPQHADHAARGHDRDLRPRAGDEQHHDRGGGPMVALRRSGVSVRAMPSTACATTAAAAACSPSSHPAPARSGVPETSRANATSSTADGRVNPHHAARSPSSPARCSPSAIPTWLDAGPGRNWHSATRSA